MAERTLRIFVSSPSDVAAERGRVKLVADRFNAQLEGIVRIDVLRWEDAFYTAAHSFQEAIDGAIGNMAATDMVLCIVWKRAGLKLNPAIWRRPDGSAYESGTVLEFETAVDVSRKQNGVPDVFLFRKSAPVVYDADRVAEQLEQYELLQAVWKRWTQSDEGYNTAGYQSFADPDDFEAKLAACLRQWLERKGVVARRPALGPQAQGLAVPRACRVRGEPHRRVLRPRGGDCARGREAAAVAVPAGDRCERIRQVVAAARRPDPASHRAGCHPRRRSVAHRHRQRRRRSVHGAGRCPVRRRCARRRVAGRGLHHAAGARRICSRGGSAAAIAPLAVGARARRAGAQGRAPLRRAAAGAAVPRARPGRAAVRRGRAGAGRGLRQAAARHRRGRARQPRGHAAQRHLRPLPDRRRRSWRCSSRRARRSTCCRRRGPSSRRS